MDGSLFAALFGAAFMALLVYGTPVYIIGIHIWGWRVNHNAGLSWQAFVFACTWLAIDVIATIVIAREMHKGDIENAKTS